MEILKTSELLRVIFNLGGSSVFYRVIFNRVGGNHFHFACFRVSIIDECLGSADVGGQGLAEMGWPERL